MNLEIGAGVGCLGRVYYSPCLESDIDTRLATGGARCPIDMVCDAHYVPASDGKFCSVIVCNPYHFGFVRERGIQLLRELVRIVESRGSIILIASSLNPYCQPQRIGDAIRSVTDGTNLRIEVCVRPLEATSRYPHHRFLRSDGSVTIPDTQITLRVVK